MFDEGILWKKGVCDWCYRKYYHDRVQEKIPDVYLEDGRWNTPNHKPTLELLERSKKAHQEVIEEMTTDVIELTTADLDRGQLCLKCLEYMLDSYYAHKQNERLKGQ